MRLYHYLDATWALDDIKRRRLKYSKIDDMNDPYEWRCVHSTDEGTQSALERTHGQTVEAYGVLCFSLAWNSILMWSHYADRHRGICLGFDVPTELTTVVKYVDSVLLLGELSAPQELLAPLDRLNWSKYSGWQYEREVRVYGRREEVDAESPHYFKTFDTQLRLREVIVGSKSNQGKDSIEDALSGYTEPVEIIKVICAPTAFEVVRDPQRFA